MQLLSSMQLLRYLPLGCTQSPHHPVLDMCSSQNPRCNINSWFFLTMCTIFKRLHFKLTSSDVIKCCWKTVVNEEYKVNSGRHIVVNSQLRSQISRILFLCHSATLFYLYSVVQCRNIIRWWMFVKYG